MKKYLNMILDKRKHIQNNFFYIGVVLSIVLLYLAFKDFNYSQFILSIKNIDSFKILLATLLLIFAVYLRALRWHFIIQEKNLSTKILCKGQFIGYFINNVFPLRAGEFIKAYYVGNKTGKSKTIILGTVFLERLFDFLGLIFLMLVLLNSNLLHIVFDNFTYIYVILLILLIGLLLLFSFKRNFFKEKIKTRLNDFIFNVVNGFSRIKIYNFMLSLLLTIIIWSVYILEVYLVQSAFNINLGFYESIFILLVSSISMILPAVPGNFGTFEGSVIYSFYLFEKYNIGTYVDDIGFSFILHLVSYIPYTIFGFIYFIQETKFLLKK